MENCATPELHRHVQAAGRERPVFRRADIHLPETPAAGVIEVNGGQKLRMKKGFPSLTKKTAQALAPEEIMQLTKLDNELLTLDELREMDGEPVWIVNVSAINQFKGHWDICDWENGERVIFPYCMEEPNLDDYDPEEKLGIAGWRAYRRKPEEAVK